MHNGNDLIAAKYLDELESTRIRDLLVHALSDEPMPEEQQIYANRNLRMEKIRYVGFDLDWTLADYKRSTMSQLAFERTLDRLVERHGYPKAVLKAEFRENFSRRGLMIDKETGMVVKMNRHRYVGRAYHGRQSLDPEERARLYRQEPLNPSSHRFHFVDTLFELPEVNIFSEIVEMADHGTGNVTLESYAQLFKDIRTAIDTIHADGSLKAAILSDLDRYLPHDDRIALALERLALSGRKLLLITNSEWFYTDALCTHLFGHLLPGPGNWRQLFDLVVVESRKPAFFKKPIPFIELDGQGEEVGEAEVPRWKGLYKGGSREALMRLLDCPGEQVLYVGDHIYGDVVSSKLSSTWRSALVVRELEEELVTGRRLARDLEHLAVLRSELVRVGQRMDDLGDVLVLFRKAYGLRSSPEPALHTTQEYLADVRGEHKIMRRQVARLQARISRSINSYWGSLFKQGRSKSLFGNQVDDFACLYTSRVSNFMFYGTNHYFRVLNDSMIHES